MTNKYLEKVAAAYPTLDYMDKAEIQSRARADAAEHAHVTSAVGGALGGVAGHFVGKKYGKPGVGAVLGAASLGYLNYKTGLATGHHESIAKSNASLKKQANEHLKDVKDTLTIGALGGAAGVASHHLLTTGRISRAIEGMSAKGKLGTIAAVGTGIGLAADYAGLKLNKATDKLLPQNKKKDQNVPL